MVLGGVQEQPLRVLDKSDLRGHREHLSVHQSMEGALAVAREIKEEDFLKQFFYQGRRGRKKEVLMKRTTIFVIFCLSVLPAGAAAPRLTLGACNDPELPKDARCGTYQVFENRAAKTGRKISLRVVVLPALGPDRLPDAIVVFAGGPGESSVGEASFLSQELARLRQHRDFLLVDSRGTGGSAPLDCPELRDVQGFLDGFVPADKVRACGERLRKVADLSQYTTDNAVDDVDEVRAALGYPQVNVMGGSYGTRSVLVYLRRHPDRVRTAILDGVVPTHDRAPLFFARSTQKALDGLIAECAGDAGCARAFPHLRDEIAAVLAAGRAAAGPRAAHRCQDRQAV